MRTSASVILLLVGLAAAVPSAGRLADPERILRDRLRFTPDEIARAGRGEPVAKLLPSAGKAELAVAGAVRIDGDPARLARWIQDIERFRSAAELGVAHVIPASATPDAFDALTLDAKDLSDLRACTSASCGFSVSTDVAARLEAIQWDQPHAADEAASIVRQMLAGRARAYASGGAATSGQGFRDLLAHATTFRALAPDLAAYFDRYPAAAPAGLESCLYWSAMPIDSGQVIALHHLAIRRTPGDIVAVDRLVYASRYFDGAALVIQMVDAPGAGFYAIAGSRMTAPDLARGAAVLLRRRIDRAAIELLQMYLGWMRESLALPSGH